MFKNKLLALNYYNTEDFNVEDNMQFRHIIVWLEDQKIRHYKIEDRQLLRDTSDSRWQTTFEEYLSDIDCPYDSKQTKLVLDWILTLAVRLEYEDNCEKYDSMIGENPKKEPKLSQSNPIDNLDFNSDQFKEGIKQLAQFLKVPTHPTDHLITLKAISLLIKNKLSMETKVEDNTNMNGQQSVKNTFDTKSVSFKIGSDKVLNNSAEILRLLFVNDLRQLQTRINELIVSVQSITAHPKTDSSLGKVGI